jgi:ribose transport system ATP-binding protein
VLRLVGRSTRMTVSSRSSSARVREPLVRLEDVSKTFPGQRALDDVSIEIAAGEIHALVGQNGSGKSTLIKILDGYHEPDPGAKGWIADQQIPFGSHAALHALGLRFIHQDLGLVEPLDIVDNLVLGRRYRTGRAWIRWRQEADDARRRLARIGLDIDVRRRVNSLSQIERTLVAITRALDDEDRINLLVLDEPTASLPRNEVQRLFDAVRRVAESGGAVLYVSHRLDEIFQLADRVTVLRDGRKVTTAEVADLDHDALVELIVGGAVARARRAEGDESRLGPAALRVEDLRTSTLHGVSFSVRSGEILGVTGLVGSGAFQLAGAVFGASTRSGGRVFVGEVEVRADNPRAAIRAGIGFVPAERHAKSIVHRFDLRENVTLPWVDARWLGPLPWISVAREEDNARQWLERLDVRPPDPTRFMATLSGGNQQKAVMSRWFRCLPSVLLLDEPVQGVDISAKHGIYEHLKAAAAQGVAVVLCSSEVEDLAHLCDRVLVLRDGNIVAELAGPTSNHARIVQESLAVTTESP